MLIGRFQPPHRAHLALMEGALDMAEDLVIVLGSARGARTARNPLSDSERAALIRQMLEAASVDLRRVRLEFVSDAYYNLPLWVEWIRRAVGRERALLTGFEKDASSFYLRLFPDWTLTPPDFRSTLNATDIREALYRGQWKSVARAVTPEVLATLRAFAATPAFAELLADREATRMLAAGGPIRTKGVLLMHGDRMLLTRRRERPGLGLWCLPEAAAAWEAAQQVAPRLDRATFESEEFRTRPLNNPQRTPGLDWQTEVKLYTLPWPTPAGGNAEWTDLDAVRTRPETFFADHAQGITALLEDWPA